MTARVPPQTAQTKARIAAGWLVRRSRELADRSAVRRAAGTVPPRRLRARTGAPGIREFREGGQEAALELAGLLPDGFAGARSILDFGCGSARVLPHVGQLVPAATLTGCDVDPTAIGWGQRHHPALTLVQSSYEPPLPFPAASFDLIYSISVFSHLDEPLQDRWLQEISRILRPGGTALLSVHGAHAFEQFRSGQVATAWCPPGAFHGQELGADQFAFVDYIRSRFNRGELPGVGAGYGLAFHGETYLREHWSRWLAVERVVPRALTGWQDVVVAQKPEPNVERSVRT